MTLDKNYEDNISTKKWFVLYTKPKQEFKAETQISAAGVETYLPTITQIKQWSDRKKKITEPLFKGYIFVFGTERDRITSLEQPSIVNSIFFNGKPATIPPKQIEDLKKVITSDEEVVVSELIKVGSRVIVADGAFKGVEGIVYSSTNNENLIAISIELLNRSVSVKLPVNAVTQAI